MIAALQPFARVIGPLLYVAFVAVLIRWMLSPAKVREESDGLAGEDDLETQHDGEVK
jgi:hypothetical protein